MNNHLLLHLSLIPSVGPATIYTLVDRMPREQFDRLYNMSAAELSQLTVYQPKQLPVLAMVWQQKNY